MEGAAEETVATAARGHSRDEAPVENEDDRERAHTVDANAAIDMVCTRVLGDNSLEDPKLVSHAWRIPKLRKCLGGPLRYGAVVNLLENQCNDVSVFCTRVLAVFLFSQELNWRRILSLIVQKWHSGIELASGFEPYRKILWPKMSNISYYYIKGSSLEKKKLTTHFPLTISQHVYCPFTISHHVYRFSFPELVTLGF